MWQALGKLASRLINWILLILAVAFGVVFAMANRGVVVVSVDPFSQTKPLLSVNAPLFLVIMGALFAGILLGGGAVWLSEGRIRQLARRRKRENRQLEKELETATKGASLPAVTAASSQGLPDKTS